MEHTSAPMCLNGIPLENKSLKYRPTNPIIIESNVYIGGNCTIYPGIKISHHSIITPNSAVTKDVEPYTMVGGVPAKVIKLLNGKND
jgi:acetyltransferase-like isoleucine patch superfamily enzyme